MYYAGTIDTIRNEINRRFPTAAPKTEELAEGEVASPSYILWMCAEVEKMDRTSMKAALKAARWMGWVFAHVECLEFWDNTRTRELVRADVQQGLDEPH